jgi:hypothetical protein
MIDPDGKKVLVSVQMAHPWYSQQKFFAVTFAKFVRETNHLRCASQNARRISRDGETPPLFPFARDSYMLQNVIELSQNHQCRNRT